MEKIFLKSDINLKYENYPFEGLKKSLKILPDDVVKKIKKSTLKGRGGAGFPTGLKWEFSNKIDSDIKIVICNGDEGEPGTFKDRYLMENMPFKVIEGILICGYATKSRYGYIYIRGEYDLAIKKIKRTIEKMYKNNLIGNNILGSNFSFDLKVIRGAGAYVCGDETSLINSIEGKRGISRIKPPLPINKGLYDKPTVVNNVETLCTCAEIMKYENDIFLEMGTSNSRGTKLVSVSGDIYESGVYEVEFGKNTINDIIKMCGGIIGKEIGMIIPGGIATECLIKEELNTLYTYEDLEKIGSSIGSGGMIIINNEKNIFEILKNVSDFFKNETCGTCFPCREGNKNINIILENTIKNNTISKEKIEIISEIKQAIGLASRCGFGQSSVNLILSILNKKVKNHEYQH